LAIETTTQEGDLFNETLRRPYVDAPPLLYQDTLAAIAGQIVEVCEVWRWMQQ
jgi:hypothetical protein